jgi:uncharacterized protein YkwD
MKKFLKPILALFLFTIATSCGPKMGDHSGGGSGEISLDGCGNMNVNSCEMFMDINTYRVSSGLPAYKSMDSCVQMAQFHAADMDANNYFDHNSPTETYNHRVKRYGLSKSKVMESIARGSAAAEVILDLLKKSDIDNKALLQTIYGSIGVGYSNGYWTICYTSLK